MGPSREFKKTFLAVGFLLLSVAVVAFMIIIILSR
jgi:hypothetical protein